MSGAFDGDLVRPLGVVTLHFGYAEYELDALLQRLARVGLISEGWGRLSMGRKLGLLTEAMRRLDQELLVGLDELRTQVRSLREHRNALLHGCILSGGRVVSAQTGVRARRTSVEALEALAEDIYSWKERLSEFRWKRVEPLLERRDIE